MNLETLRDFCLGLPHVTEGLPFGEKTLVFKVAGKMFLLVSLDTGILSFNVKCDPEEALVLRDMYPDRVKPGYHMNKKHWNSIEAGASLPDSLLRQWVKNSYELVFNSLSKKTRDSLL